MALVRVADPVVDRKEAWDAYLSEINRLPPHDYEEREPYAWRRLVKRLREIDRYEEFECR